MNLYVPLDVDYAADPKVLRAGALAELLFVRSLALAKRLKSDGAIEAVHLPGLTLGIPGKPDTHAASLVAAGLWITSETGWSIVAWAKRNKSRAEIDEKHERLHRAGLKANHDRWHTSDRQSDSCPFCNPDRIVTGIRPESTKTETKTETKTDLSLIREIVTNGTTDVRRERGRL